MKDSQTLEPVHREQFQSYLEAFVSSSKAGKIMTLEAGLEYQQLSLNPEDAQLLETRRLQVEDICRWFGVPPIVIGHAASSQTMWGTGVESIMLAWLMKGINPRLKRHEARMARDLLPIERRGRWFPRWDREAMLQMDSKALTEKLTKLVAGGILTSDEARSDLGQAPRGGAADELRAQIATAPIEDNCTSVMVNITR